MFLSPEQLANEETRQTLVRAAPGLFVVDEAHLISQWGHDFRPDYMMLGAQAEAIGAPVRLALTATAAPPVRQEITGGLACAIRRSSSATSTGRTSTCRFSRSLTVRKSGSTLRVR